MKIPRFFLFLFFITIFSGTGICQRNIPVSPDEVCINKEEMKLYRLINDYRKSNGLKEIPLSKNLTIVAQTHAIDLFINNPHDDYLCNMHSWSDKGEWQECCYTSDHANAECMWYKPGELTSYTGKGYEIAFFFSPVSEHISMAKESLDAWKTSPGHNNTIINRAVFRNAEWNAIGIGIFEEYVTVWFGEQEDLDGVPGECQ